MKRHIFFSRKNMKNISKCRLQLFPSLFSIKTFVRTYFLTFTHNDDSNQPAHAQADLSSLCP